MPYVDNVSYDVVTGYLTQVKLTLLFALKGSGNRAFYRWIFKNMRDLFPKLPEWTRLFRLFN